MLGDESNSLIPHNNDDPHTSILHLEAELHKQSENCEKMSLSIKQGEVDLKKKDEEIVQQKNKVRCPLQIRKSTFLCFCSLYMNY